jgi:hypothetical protein
MKAYKIFTHDLRPPVQGGAPVWDGLLPFQLPVVEVDRSPVACAAGWHAHRTLAGALKLGGVWPSGRPSRAFMCSGDETLIVDREGDLRAPTWLLEQECSATEIAEAIREMSQPFDDLADHMAASQIAWREALGRPLHDPGVVERQLRAALQARGRGLENWALRQYGSARAAMNACNARAAWDTTWDIMGSVWTAYPPKSISTAWKAISTWDSNTTFTSAKHARDGLALEYVSLRCWVDYDPLMLTTGIREAYRNGLAIAVPTAPTTIGWALEEK